MLASRRLRLWAFAVGVIVAVWLLRSFVPRGAAPAAGSYPAADAAVLTALSSVSWGADAQGGPPPAAGAGAGVTSDPPDWAVDPSEPVALAGRVLVDGRGSARASVSLVDELTSDGLTPKRVVTLDPEGRFQLVVPRVRGRYRISASAPGLAPAALSIPGDLPRADLELRLETCKLHIHGTVADASGGVVPGARIFFARVPEHVAVADGSGAFQLCAAERSERLRVEAEGYGPWARNVSARDGLRQDVTLTPKAEITGVVLLSTTTPAATTSPPSPAATTSPPSPAAPTSPAKTPPSIAVRHAIVVLRDRGETVRAVQADADGRFRLSPLAPGHYTIEARSLGARSSPVDVTVFASETRHVRVIVDARVVVQGKVIDDRGVPVARAWVDLGFPATSTRCGNHTRADGTFAMPDCPAGSLEVVVDHHEVVSSRSIHVPPAGASGFVVQVRARPSLEVTVTEHGAPVSDATISLRGASGSETRSSDAAGVATFEGLTEPRYRVMAERTSAFAVAEAVAIPTGAGRARVSLELGRGVTASGHVVDTDGHPVEGARVTFLRTDSPEDGSAWAVTGPDGTFRGGPLRGPATYRAKVTRSGIPLEPASSKGSPSSTSPASPASPSPAGTTSRTTAPDPLLVVRGAGPDARAEPADLVIRVETQDRRVEGRIEDAHHEPVADALVTVAAPGRRGQVHATTSTGQDGTFVVRGLARGPYAVKARALDGGEAEVGSVTLPSSPLAIVLAGAGTIRGSIDGFTANPSVMVWSVAGYEWDFHPVVLEAGRFTVPALSAGRYHVAAATREAAAHATVEVKADAISEVRLVASGTRTLRGRTLDFLSGGPLPQMECVVAPYVTDTRCPVVVPGAVSSDEEGRFELAGVPASALYMWCSRPGPFGGGVARMPDGSSDEVRVWGLDLRGQPALDTRSLGFTLAEDHPFSRRIVALEARGPAERSGLRVGDVIDDVGGRSVAELGNGVVRSYLALRLLEEPRVAVTVTRGDASVPVTFRSR